MSEHEEHDPATLRRLLAEERAEFRSELAAGAAELAQRDEVVRRLRAHRDRLVVQRDKARRQRDRARAEVARFRRSRLARAAVRVSGLLSRVRRGSTGHA